MAPKVILTGFMATGKTVVARSLARRLGWPLIDCDAEIVARAGKPISEIFRESGEAGFRELERETIARIALDERRCPQCGKLRPSVIATGGGAILDERNFDLLNRCGVIVCLAARPEVIARRVGRSARSRPMLAGKQPLRKQITELLELRRGAYARAPLTVDTSNLTVDQVVETIIDMLAARRKSAWPLSA